MEDNSIRPDPTRVYIDDQINQLRSEQLTFREKVLDVKLRSKVGAYNGRQ